MSVSYSDLAIQSVQRGMISFCKMLSANDTGQTGGHQSGIYIPKQGAKILFSEPGKRGENKKKTVHIYWPGYTNTPTESIFTYYGKGTRNEYRITRFGRGFTLLGAEHTGDLFVLTKIDDETYEGFMLSTEEEINAFLDYFCISITDMGSVITKQKMAPEEKIETQFSLFIQAHGHVFPDTKQMSGEARRIYDAVYNHEEFIRTEPDKRLVQWLDIEYKLFRKMEDALYGDVVYHGFSSMQHFIDVANSILNRRKSRAGKSLENHLAAIFDGNHITYDAQLRTEGHKTPDFIFPGGDVYHDPVFPASRLIALGAKTTCKDRWRQVLTEADRVAVKHIFTLQQGISAAQLDEMKAERVVLVVPKQYISTYPANRRQEIMDLQTFISYVKEKEQEP